MSDRKKAIETLKQLRLDYEEFYEEHNNEVTHAYDMAIASLEVDEAYQLEYEPTTKNDLEVDCISRADAIKGLGEQPYVWTDSDYEIQQLTDWKNHKEMLENLPSVTPQAPRWIPVSERLPKPFMYVNATCRSLVDDREDWVVETIYLPIPKEANKHGYSDWGNIPMLNWGEAEVIAWMERIIPEPYVRENNTDKEQI